MWLYIVPLEIDGMLPATLGEQHDLVKIVPVWKQDIGMQSRKVAQAHHQYLRHAAIGSK
jgi:hypothetical protein